MKLNIWVNKSIKITCPNTSPNIKFITWGDKIVLFISKLLNKPSNIDPVIPAIIKKDISSLKLYVSFFDIIFIPKIQLRMLTIGCNGCNEILKP